MTSIFGRVAASALAASSLYAIGVARAGQIAPGGIGPSFALRSPTVSLHEPVVLDFTFKNTSDGPVVIDLGKNRNTKFGFVISHRGKSLRCPPLSQAGFGRTGEISLKAGESVTQTLVLNLWYSFDDPGTYEIRPAMTTPVRAQGGASVTASQGAPLALIVTPRDVGRLKRVCSELINDALSENVTTALSAAQELSYVEDMVAVSFLTRVTERGDPVREFGIQGLARIARAEGLEALLPALGPRRADLEPQVRQALANLGANIAD
jgi:hypothetical protein